MKQDSTQQRSLVFWIILPILLIGLAIQFEINLGGFVQNVLGPVSSGGDSGAGSSTTANGSIAPLFTPTVARWDADFARWSSAYDIDANLLATLFQVESCGHPALASPAGAQGLMQVMPFHFAENENPLDVETNVRRGVGVFSECLLSDYNPERDLGLAFACYNAGPSVLVSGWDYWPYETRSFYTWTTNIYADAQAGLAASDTLERWLAAGGVNMCAQAEAHFAAGG